MKRVHKSIAAAVIGTAIGVTGGTALLHGASTPPPVTPKQMATANDLSTAFREVGKAVQPSVVNISVHKKVPGVSAKQFNFDNDMLRRFFNDNPQFQHAFPQLPGNPDNRGQDDGNGNNDNSGGLDQVGTGSGVIMEVDGSVGYILTNNHVAGDASEMVVTLADGRKIDNAKLVGADPKSDLAVVKITADNLVAAKWGDGAELHRGDWVIAFGSPFGYTGSMTHGIISALDRSNVGILGANGYEDFIQVDAPINPGNSGGPLVDLQGEVIGINTAIASRTGAFSGIGFAIPSKEAHVVFSALKEHGAVVRGWLGVSIGDASRDPKLVQSFGYDKKTGVLVESSVPGAPAEGKLQHGDIITGLNGKPVENALQLRNAVADLAPDTEITLNVFRDKKETSVSIKLGTQPKDLTALVSGHGSAQGESSANALGLTMSDANDDLARRFDLGQDHHGALVTNVKPGSLADRAGIRPGDLITEVGSTNVNNADQASGLLSKQDAKTGIRLYVVSPDGAHYVFIEASK